MANDAIPAVFHRWSNSMFGMLLFLLLSCTANAALLDPYQDFFDGTPALALDDLGHNLHSVQDYRGRVVLINFWTSWCAPCLVEMPALERLQQAMSGKPFTILAVNVGESHGKVWNFASKLKLGFPMLLDSDGQAAADWRVGMYPTTYLVDAQGTVQYVAYGPRRWDSEEMIQAIEAMLVTSRANGQQVKSRNGSGPVPAITQTQKY